jgi:transcription elongation factor Elf1
MVVHGSILTMMLEAMFSWVTCPVCGNQMLVTAVRVYNDPELAAEECSGCGALIQVSRDPATGEIKTEMVKEN